jgi:DNA-binding phage protein
MKQRSSLPRRTGRLTVVFEERDLVRLLRAAVEREGGQSAFAKRHNVDRSRVNRILSGQLRASEAIAKALGLRRAYVAD